MDLAELKFKVDTSELSSAAKLAAELGTAVQNLNTPIQNLANSSQKAAKAIQDTANATQSAADHTTDAGTKIDKVSKIIEKNVLSMRILRDQAIDAADGTTKLGDGFTKSQSNMLAYLKQLGATTEQMHLLAASFKEYNEIAGINTFDKSAGGLAKIRKEATELARVNELVTQGFNLTRDQVVLLSRDMIKMEQVFGKGTKEMADAQARLIQEFTAEANALNVLVQQSKEAEAAAKQQAAAFKAGNEMMDSAVAAFRKNEQEKLAAIQRTTDALEHQHQIANYMAAGFNKADATKIATFTASGGSEAEIIGVIGRQRELAKAQHDQMVAQREAEAQTRKVAAANEYLSDVEARLVAQINEANAAMGERYTNQLLKIEKALIATGMSTDQVALKMQHFRKLMEGVAGKDMERQLNHLARAISVQMGDVAISLASGMNPLLVMIQQGDQIRGAIQQAKKEGVDLQRSMTTAATQIAVSFKDTAVAIGGFFVGAIKSSGAWFTNTVAGVLGMKSALDTLGKATLDSEGNVTNLTKVFSGLGSVLSTVVGGAIAVAIATIIALGVELYKMMKITTDLSRNLILFGASFGMTKKEAIAFAESMKIAGSSTLDVMNVMSAVAAKSEIPRSALAGITQAALELEHYGGQAIDKTVEMFAKLTDNPSKGLLEFAKNTGLISMETVQLVSNLEKQGKTVEAVKVAMQAMTTATLAAAALMKSELSPLEQLWIDIKSEIKLVGQALYDMANDKDAINFLRKELATIAYEFNTLVVAIKSAWLYLKLLATWEGIGGKNEDFNKVKQEILDLGKAANDTDKRLQDLYSGKNYAKETKKFSAASDFGLITGPTEEELAKARQAVSELSVAQQDWNKVLDSNRDNAQKMNSEIAKVTNTYNNLKKAFKEGVPGAVDPKESDLKRAIAEIERKYKPQKSDADKIHEKAMRDLKKLADLEDSLTGKVQNLTKAEIAFEQIKNSEDWAKYSAADKQAIEDKMKLARNIELAARETDRINKANEEYTKQIEANGEVTRKMITMTRELNKELDDSINRYDLEVSMIGKSNEEKELALKIYDAEIKAQKEKIKLQQEFMNIKDPTKQDWAMLDSQLSQVDERLKNSIDFFTRQMNDKVFKEIQDGITDAIATGLFEGGEAGKKKLRDLLVKELRKKITLQIEVWVNALMQNGADFLGGIMGLADGQSASGSGTASSGLGAINSASTAYGLGSKLYSGYQSGGVTGAWNSLFSSTGTSAGTSAGLGSLVYGGTNYALVGTGTTTGIGATAGQGMTLIGGTSGSGGGLTAVGSSANGYALTGTGTSGSGITATAAGSEVAGGGTSSAFTSAGAAAVYAILAYLGIKFSSKWFKEGFTGKEQMNDGGITSALWAGSGTMEGQYVLEKWLGLSKSWSNILSGTVGINKLIGMAAAKPEAYGVTGSFGKGGDFSGKMYQDYYQKGGVFRKSKWWTDTTELPDNVNNVMDAVGKATLDGVKEYGKTLGLVTDQLDSVSTSVKIEFGNFKNTTSEVDKLSQKYGEDLTKPFEQLSDKGKEIVKTVEYYNAVTADVKANVERLTEAAQLYENDLIASFGPQVAQFAKYGETVKETIARLATSLSTMNDALKLAGLGGFEKSLEGADKAGKFADVFGGVDKAASALSAYYDAMFTEEEKQQKQLDILKSLFADMNLEMPNSIAGYRALTEATMAAGNGDLVAKLVALAPAFAELANALDMVNPAEATTSTNYQRARSDVQNARDLINNLYKDQTDALDKQISAAQELVNANQANVQAAQQNVEAVKQTLDQWRSFRDQIVKMRSDLFATAGLETKSSKYGNLVGAADRAKSGDMNALGDLATYSQEYVAYAKDNATTYLDYLREVGKTNTVLAGVEDYANTQVSAQEQQLNLAQMSVNYAASGVMYAQQQVQALEDQKAQLTSQKELMLQQLDAALGINETLLSMEDAWNLVNTVLGNLGNASGSAVGNSGGSAGGAGTMSSTGVMQYLVGLAAKNMNHDEIIAAAKAQYGLTTPDIEYFAKLAGIPGFARGGAYGGGLALVGEQGPELINFDNGGKVYTNGQTNDLMGLSANLEVHMKDMSMNIEMLLEEIRRSSAVSSRVLQLLKDLTPEGDSLKVSFIDTPNVHNV